MRTPVVRTDVRVRILGGLLVLAVVAICPAWVAAQTEVVRNGGFSRGMAEWNLNPALPAGWDPLTPEGQVTLHPAAGFVGTVIHQSLNVTSVGGAAFTLSFELTKISAPGGHTVAADVTYVDTWNLLSTVRVVAVDNDTITAGTLVSQGFTLPGNARKLVRLAFVKTGPGDFTVDNVSMRASGVVVGVVPVITRLSTPSLKYGSALTITGYNFGTAMGRVLLDGSEIGIRETGWTPTSVNVVVNDPAQSGAVTVEVDYVESNVYRGLEILSPHYSFDVVNPEITVVKGQRADVVARVDFRNGFTTSGGIAFTVVPASTATRAPAAPVPFTTYAFTPVPVKGEGGVVLKVDTSTLAAGTYQAAIQAVERTSASKAEAFTIRVVTVASYTFKAMDPATWVWNEITSLDVTRQGPVNVLVSATNSDGGDVDPALITLSSSDPQKFGVYHPMFWGYSMYARDSGAATLLATGPDGSSAGLPIALSLPATPRVTSVGFSRPDGQPITNAYNGPLTLSAGFSATNLSSCGWGLEGLISISCSGLDPNGGVLDWTCDGSGLSGTCWMSTNPPASPPEQRVYAVTGSVNQSDGEGATLGSPLEINNDPAYSQARGSVKSLDPFQSFFVADFTLEFYARDATDPAVPLFTRQVFSHGPDYTVGAIPAGVYKLRYAPFGGMEPQWYPNASSAADARAVTFAAGKTVSDVFFFAKSSGTAMPELVVSPGLVQFPETKPGVATTTSTIIVTNTSEVQAAIGTVAISGSGAAAFAITGDQCSSRTLAPNGVCTIGVRFLSAVPGAFQAALEIPLPNPPNPGDLPPAGAMLAGVASDNQYVLTVESKGLGSGLVIGLPAGIACGTDCEQAFDAGTVVILSATPEAGSTFDGWIGGGCSGTEPCHVRLTADTQVTARFGNPSADTCDAVLFDNGNIAACGYTATTTVKLAKAATLDHVHAWYHWADGETSVDYTIKLGTKLLHTGTLEKGACDPYQPRWCGGEEYDLGLKLQAGTYVMTLGGAKQCQNAGSGGNGMAIWHGCAAGTPPAKPTITVRLEGAGDGTVKSTVAGIDCGTKCRAAFTLGAKVTLKVTPAAGSTFAGWSGACTGTATTCVVKAAGDQTAVAGFSVPDPQEFSRIDDDPNTPGIWLYPSQNHVVRNAGGQLWAAYGKRVRTPDVAGWFNYVAASSDGGKTWSEPVRTESMPDSNGVQSLVIDDAGVLHQGFTFNVGSFYTRSGDQGQTWTPATELLDGGWGTWDYHPSLALDGTGRLHAVFFAAYGWDDPPYNIYYRYSDDGGSSWSAARALTTLPNVAASGYGALSPDIAADPTGRLFVLYDVRLASGTSTKMLLHFDGTTWRAPLAVSTGKFSYGGDLAIASTGLVHLAFQQQNLAKVGQLVYRTYTPSTRTLGAAKIVTPPTLNVGESSIGVYADNKVYLAYDLYDTTTGRYGGVYVRSSADNFAAARRISTSHQGRSPNLRSATGMARPANVDLVWIEPNGEAGGEILAFTELTGDYSSSALDTVTGTIGALGGALTLGNGTSLIVPPGATAGAITVTLVQRAADRVTIGSGHGVYDITTTGDLATATLSVTIPAGKRGSRYAAVYIDPATGRRVLLRGTVVGDTFQVTLDPTGVEPPPGSPSAATPRDPIVGTGTTTVIIEEDPGTVTLTRNTYRMALPYYEQDGGNCWAAVWLMFLNSYSDAYRQTGIYNLLQETGVEKNDGLAWYKMDGTGSSFSLAQRTTAKLGLPMETRTWVSWDNFVDYVLKTVDSGRPVMVNMIAHQGLFLGYDIVNPGAPNEEIYFIYHDPQNNGTQIANRRIRTDALKTQFWTQGTWSASVWNYFSTIAAQQAPEKVPVLQTIHMPDTETLLPDAATPHGLIFFKHTDPTHGFVSGQVVWDHQAAPGYRVETPVPRFTDLTLGDIPVWNMDPSTDVPVTITTKVSLVKDGTVVTPAIWTRAQNQTVTALAAHRYLEQMDANPFYLALGNLIRDGLLTVAEQDARFQVDVSMTGPTGTLGGFSAQFEHEPVIIKGLLPPNAPTGEDIHIEGSGFGHARNDSYVTFCGVTLDQDSHFKLWTSTRVTVTVPAGLNCVGSGVKVYVRDEVRTTLPYYETNVWPFKVGPMIKSLVPPNGAVGTAVTINGAGFGAAQGTGRVTFKGVAAAITSWTDTVIRTVVPAGALTGDVVVRANDVDSNGVNFIVGPDITSIAPGRGKVGDAVVITGVGFGATRGTSTVTFNGVAGVVVSWSDRSIKAKVPNTRSGDVVVTVGGTASGGYFFTVDGSDLKDILGEKPYAFGGVWHTSTYACAPSDGFLCINGKMTLTNAGWSLQTQDYPGEVTWTDGKFAFHATDPNGVKLDVTGTIDLVNRTVATATFTEVDGASTTAFTIVNLPLEVIDENGDGVTFSFSGTGTSSKLSKFTMIKAGAGGVIEMKYLSTDWASPIPPSIRISFYKNRR